MFSSRFSVELKHYFDRPSPLVTMKVITLDASCTACPAESTTVARTNAVSWPSASNAVPVPVSAEGASNESTSAAAAPDVNRVSTATTLPSGSRPTAVAFPAAHLTLSHSACRANGDVSDLRTSA